MRILLLAILSFFLLACQASEQEQSDAERVEQEVRELARKNNGGKDPTEQDLWKALVQKAQQASGSTLDYGNYRQVLKGAKPEIVLSDNKIIFDNEQVVFGDNISNWISIIGKPDRHYDNLYIWDSLGFTVSTTPFSKNSAVVQLELVMNKQPKDPYAGLVTELPDGTPIKPRLNYRPENVFSGYLEVDGYGVDSKTQYWEIESRIDPSRELHCSFEGCAHAHGRGLSIILNRNDEKGNIEHISISK